MKQFSKSPIIIGGCGRSGTTLLLSIIAAHPNIHAFSKEIGVFLEWRKLKESSDINFEYHPRLDRLYRFILTDKISKQANRWCEKTPGNVRNFDKILDYFNEKVKLIHIIRDGRDVMLSKHPKKSDAYWISPERWVNDVRIGLKFKKHPNVLTIKYEDLILSYEETIEEICDFLGEECTEEMYNWFDNTNVRKNEAWSGSVRKLHSNSVAKWEKEDNKERVNEIMQNRDVVNLLEDLDYL